MNALGLTVLPDAPQDTYPSLCINMGLTCQACTEESARHLATTCLGLRGPAVRQLFVQIYPDPACSAMAWHFERSYKGAALMLQAGAAVREMNAGRSTTKAMTAACA